MQVSAYDVIERELTRLVRSAEQVHRRLQLSGDLPRQLERAAYRLLAHVVTAGPLRLSMLAELACVDSSTVSRQIGQLAAQGLLVRQSDPADGRAALLAATAEGARLFAVTREARNRFVRDVVASWPARDRDEFGRLLARFNDGVASSLPARRATA